VNVGIGHTIIKQVTTTASAEATNEVKDETMTLDAVGEVSDENMAESVFSENEQVGVITTYTVKSGDTLGAIASSFDISVNTIRWANDLTAKSTIKQGDELIILPVTGIEYTVKKGDTLSGIAVKYDAKQSEILSYNDIDEGSLKIGMKIIIPEAEPLPEKVPAKKAIVQAKPNVAEKSPMTTLEKTAPITAIKAVVETVTPSVATIEKKVEETKAVKFTNPIPCGILTQGTHDGSAVDFGAPIGTKVVAAAAGTVTVAKTSGYNGGYGLFVAINHGDGSQTQYSHLSKVSVSVGDKVAQGEQIGLSGNSGKSTGPHLHYNERNTGNKNTFSKFKTGTYF